MAARMIKEQVYWVGAIDWHRRLFDELIPLPDGTTYNAYLIRGTEKTALIDTVDPTKEKELLANLEELGVKQLDYVISNHAEQDHSGSIPKILEHFPEAKVVTNAKCKAMLMELLLIPEEKFLTVEDRQTLSLGDKTLEFILFPWVHWPETMFTYLREAKILFTCDFLGSHLATADLFVTDQPRVYRAAKRYYAEIMMPFRSSIKSNWKKISELDFEIAAASHGPVYRQPEFILNAYQDWVSDSVKNEVLIPYISMHASTERMVEYLVDALLKRGIKVTPFNLTRTDLGELAIALVDAATLVIGTPTVLAGAHPGVVSAAYLVNLLRPKLRFASIIGSYGWGGKMKEDLLLMLGNLKVSLIDPVIIKGYPKKADFLALDKLAEEILNKHKNL